MVQRCVARSNRASVTACIELDVAAQVEAIGDVVRIAQDLRLRGEQLAPVAIPAAVPAENEYEYCMLSTSQRAPG